MAKVRKMSCKSSRRHQMTPYPLPSCQKKSAKDGHAKKKHSKASERKDWQNANCPVCLEFPHNAVLLLCSSYDKGCRPYMCATNRRFSNCLEQYKKAYTKVTSVESSQQRDDPVNHSIFHSGSGSSSEKVEVPELLCPLCRGQVKGWTVVDPARKYLNAKKRTCLQHNCSFVGTFKQLKKHVRAQHPLARPRAVDPVLEEKWKKLEGERERNDVISTIMSSTPGAVVLGDYVLEPGYQDSYTSDEFDSDDSCDDVFFRDGPFDRGQNGVFPPRMRDLDHDLSDDGDLPLRRAPSAHFLTSARGLHRIFRRTRRQWR